MVGGGRRTEGSVREMEEAESDEPSPSSRVGRPAADRLSPRSATSVSNQCRNRDDSFSGEEKADDERGIGGTLCDSSPSPCILERIPQPFSEINASGEPTMEIDEARGVPSAVVAKVTPATDTESSDDEKSTNRLECPARITDLKDKDGGDDIVKNENGESNNSVEDDYQDFVKLLKNPEITQFLWGWMKTNVVQNPENSDIPRKSNRARNTKKFRVLDSKDKTGYKKYYYWKPFGAERALLYLIVTAAFITQFFLYTYLYDYISQVEHKIPQCRSKRDSGDNAVLKQDSANVEFFNPKIRQELEDKERAQQNATGEQNNWVWLTSYSRIPLVAIQGFCSATKEYCPPGPIGPPGAGGEPGKRGEPGAKGERGERGAPGDPGSRGLTGAPGDPGPRGPKGNQGPPGTPGLDGRDGVPGEPGLDGMPGRNGRDGKPGLYGSPGTDGIPGKSGYNGTDGIPGKMGPQGPSGVSGPRGLPGPRGKPGKPGINGTPGIPGVTAYEISINGTKSSDLLIPPTIIGSEKVFHSGPIVVNEGDNLRLRCGAAGYPMPSVEWKKIDKKNHITQGKWHESAIMGNAINITRVNRDHMGTYMCIASNGIPPSANQSFEVEVHFPPLININNQYIPGYMGRNATLLCNEEAFPEGLKYWERKDGRVIEKSDKYNINVVESGNYRMQLEIVNVTMADIGVYHCISRNEIGTAKGALSLYEKKPGMSPPPLTGLEGPTYGQRPPDAAAYDELCPPPPPCKDCPDPKEFKCRQGIYSLYDLLGHRDLEIRPLDANSTYPGLPNRTLDCQVYAVGKPVFHRLNEHILYGSWMRDPSPRSESDNDKYWVTKDSENQVLFEYINKTVFSHNNATFTHRLEYPFVGNAHLVYNGSFFYNHKNKPQVVKYDLLSRRSQLLQLPYASLNESNLLYTTQHNYMDFALDENGLWVVYGLMGTNNTAVIKLDAYSLEIQFGWNISLKHQKAGEVFIVCGVLYVVDSTQERRTNIRFALDLYKNQLLEDVSIEFTNPFKKTTMISYNHRNKELYTWDRGHQLTYPIKVHDVSVLSTKEDKGEPEANALQSLTGFEIVKMKEESTDEDVQK